MKIGFRDTEGRRFREDGRRVVYIWPLTDFDGHRNDVATARHLAWHWYVLRPVWWSGWFVADAWDPHGKRRHDMSSAPRAMWWPVLWPVAVLGRWVHRNCRRCKEDDDDHMDLDEAPEV